jgi:deoxyribonuclease-4
MKWVGAHVSIAGGVQNAPLNAAAIGARAFAMFTKNQRQWRAKPYSAASIDGFHANMRQCGFLPEQVLPHDSYLINIGSPDPKTRAQSRMALIDELERCKQLGLRWLNIHPGSHLRKITEAQCLDTIAEGINRAFDAVRDVGVALENTAGQGSNVGYRFEHLAHIIDRIDDKGRIGACIDTCHASAAGYDIGTLSAFNATIESFDAIVGLRYLRGMHLNDAKSEFGSRVDRHHSIGEGTLGLDPFRFIMTDSRFDAMPLILETIDDNKWPAEIQTLYAMERS